MSPREAGQTDPMQRLQLMTTYEALEMAGYAPDRTASTHHTRVGTFFAQSSDDWRQANTSQDIGPMQIVGSVRAFGPGRVHYHFGWEGPSFSIDTACSGSSSALYLACNALRTRQCDTAIVGGTNIMTASDPFAGLSRGGFLSLTGSCKTWDQDADGYCRGDAVATLVVKRLSDAIADNDNVHAVIRSIVMNHSANAVSLTFPHAPTQELLLREVLREADIGTEEVEYVEMHGTGTQAGDVEEPTAVWNVFGKRRVQPLYLGAVKANIGHSEAASGVSSIIKATLMLRKRVIVPHVGIKTAVNNKMPPLEASNILIPRTKIPFISNANERKRILVNNFSAAGGNTALILEDPPVKPSKTLRDPCKTPIAVISGSTPYSLKENVSRLIDFLKAKPNVDMMDLSYTLTARRMHHSWRTAYHFRSIDDLVSKLVRGHDLTIQHNPKTVITIFMFTGQASSYPGMGRELFKRHSVFRDSVVTSNAICEKLDFPSFLDFIFLDEDNIKSDHMSCYTQKAEDVIKSQLALVALEIALARLWQSLGVQPKAVIGHSLGEYSALCVAGVLSVLDTLYLVGKRATLMTLKCETMTHGMLAVNLSTSQLLNEISKPQYAACSIACYNQSDANVVSGPSTNLETLREQLTKEGIVSSILSVPFAFHSSQIDPLLVEYEAVASRVHYGAPTIPVASTLRGDLLIEKGVINGTYLAQQMREPVLFTQAILDLQRRKFIDENTVWIEIGPRSSLIAMVAASLNTDYERMIPRPTTKGIIEDEAFADSLARAFTSGVDIHWSEYHREYEDSLTLLELPSYAFDLKNYWIQYEGDWAVRKGDPASSHSRPSLESILTGTGLQAVEKERHTDEGVSIVLVSNLQDRQIQDIAASHLLNNVAMLPASFHAHVALAAASCMWRRTESYELPAMEVCDMVTDKALMIHSDEPARLIRVTATRQRKANMVNISIATTSGTKVVDHAHCAVRFGDQSEWLSHWTTEATRVQARIRYLQSANENCERVSRSKFYRLFSHLIKYDKKYQGVQMACINMEALEATAQVRLQPCASDQSIDYRPYWLDSLAHLSGFVLNTSDVVLNGGKDLVCVSHGWGSMRFAKSLSLSSVYQTYVCMKQSNVKGMFSGDIYILDDAVLVAMFKDVHFQSVERSILRTILEDLHDQIATLKERQDDGNLAPPIQQRSEVNGSYSISSPSSQTSSTAPTSTPDVDAVEIFKQIMAYELEIAIDDMQPHVNFSDLGLSSIPGLTVLAEMRSQIESSLPLSFFDKHQTLSDVQGYFRPKDASTPSDPGQPDEATQPLPCTPLFIQDATSTHAPSLFLFPDGFGSASTYANIPNLSSQIRLVAFSSPFASSRPASPVTIPDITTHYLSALLAQQPHGPYILGGYSIGGIYAYDVALQLIARGEEVRGLLIIDTPAPHATPPMPVETIKALDSVGLFSGFNERKPSCLPQNVVEHFAFGSAALREYRPVPMRQGDKRPKCMAVWAGQTVDKGLNEEAGKKLGEKIGDDEAANYRWLLAEREDHGPGGWEDLMPGIECRVVDAHHFSIIKERKVRGNPCDSSPLDTPIVRDIGG